MFSSAAFKRWTRAEMARRPLVLFRVAFALVWLVYDVIDFTQRQTLGIVDFSKFQMNHTFFTAAQLTVIVCELGLLIGFKARWFAFGACLARGVMAYFFGLNDFLYYSVVAFILSQADCENASSPKALAWPRDVLILQTAWIYFSTAFLKLNPLFTTGGDLYVRQNYIARTVFFYYPEFYLKWISDIGNNAVLAWGAIVGEFTLAALLFIWWFKPKRRKELRRGVILLACCIHLYAAYFLDVFFFGASMLAQVILLTLGD